jgi:hypothetical protein
MKKALILIFLLTFMGTATAGEGRLCHHLDRFIKHAKMMEEDRLQLVLDARERSTIDPETIKQHEDYIEKIRRHILLVELLFKDRNCEK